MSPPSLSYAGAEMASLAQTLRPRLLKAAQTLLNRTIGEVQAAEARGLPANRAQSFITLLRSIDELTASLFAGIAATFGNDWGAGRLCERSAGH